MRVRLIDGIVLGMMVLAVSCGPLPKPRHPQGGTETKKPTPPEEMTPERTASNALIDDGQKAFDQGLYDQTTDLFQESVRIDPSNGAGYYYLALTKTRTGEYGEAWGLFEKAETLLAKNPDWKGKLDMLRSELEQKKPN